MNTFGKFPKRRGGVRDNSEFAVAVPRGADYLKR